MNPMLDAARRHLNQAQTKQEQGYPVQADIDILRALNYSRRMRPRLGECIRREARVIVEKEEDNGSMGENHNRNGGDARIIG